MKLTKRSFAGAALSAAGSFLVLGTQSAKAEHHSHIHASLESLRDARSELKDSKHDYGRHRDEALHAIDEAIHQLEIIERWERDHR